MTDTAILDLMVKYQIRVVRRPGVGDGYQWVAYNGRACCADVDLRRAIAACVVEQS